MWWLMAALPNAFSSDRRCLIKNPRGIWGFFCLLIGISAPVSWCLSALVRLGNETIEVT